VIKIIIKNFIKDYKDVDNKQVRESYGVLGGVIGTICNLLLFIVKLTIGLYMNSIAVISDAFNNLSDLGSSLIAIIGTKMSNRPPDNEHPYGHGRIEYISSLIVSFIIFSVGLELLRGSFRKILNPETVVFNPLLMAILIFSVLVKIWMFSYNTYISKTVNSSISKATAYDSLSDAFATSALIITTIIGQFFDFPLDGIAGLVISVLILYTGFSIAKETVNLLLGSSPDSELVKSINSMILEGKHIIGIHDLIVHDYGPGRKIASIHAEVPYDISILDIHSVIDDLEKRVLKELGVNLVVHMDPISRDHQFNSKQ